MAQKEDDLAKLETKNAFTSSWRSSSRPPFLKPSPLRVCSGLESANRPVSEEEEPSINISFRINLKGAVFVYKLNTNLIRTLNR